MTSHDQPFDWKEALEFASGRRELVMELVDLFMEEGPGLIAEIGKAIEAQDAKVVQERAHRLKGSLKYFGTSAAADRAAELEAIGSEQQLADMPSKFAELKTAMDDLIPHLRKGPPE
jgi:HPt (histidine-containing phosphotransfer) domain-containing protein